MPDGRGEGFFYQFPDRTAPVPKEGYVWSAADQPFQDVMDSTFNEVALDYNAGITASFAWLTAHGASRGGPLPDSEFPPREVRTETEDLKLTDREFFVAARLVRSEPGKVELEATVNNRSRWPARVCTNLSFRIYLGGDPRVDPRKVSVTVVPGGSGSPRTALAVQGDPAFVEVSFPGEAVFPGDLQRSRRTVRLGLTAAELDPAQIASLKRLTSDLRLLPELPVFESGRLVGGIEPR